MLTEKRPFPGETSAEIMSAILRDTPHPVNEISVGLPNHLGRIVRRCLNKDPNERYQTARDLFIELKELKQEISDSERRSINSIAVLPFANMSPDPEQEYFCEGIAEELINGLGRIKNLRVASRTSAFQFKGTKHDIREIGERLNVEKVVEGSVRKSGNQVRSIAVSAAPTTSPGPTGPASTRRAAISSSTPTTSAPSTCAAVRSSKPARRTRVSRWSTAPSAPATTTAPGWRPTPTSTRSGSTRGSRRS